MCAALAFTPPKESRQYKPKDYGQIDGTNMSPEYYDDITDDDSEEFYEDKELAERTKYILSSIWLIVSIIKSLAYFTPFVTLVIFYSLTLIHIINI